MNNWTNNNLKIKKSNVLTFRLSPSQQVDFDWICKKHNLTKSYVIRFLIDRFIKKYEKYESELR
jgi:predicted DNA-binding protein